MNIDKQPETMNIDKQPETIEPPPAGALLWESTVVYQIFGSNTDVGKTVFSTILCKCTSEYLSHATSYLKPISAGEVSDAEHVRTFCPNVNTQTLYQWASPVSPHIAATMPGVSPEAPEDEMLLNAVRGAAEAFHAEPSRIDKDEGDEGERWMFIETAGGVLSPMPSSSTQADVYSNLRLPVILVGDSKLGGISQTISAYESLRLRGYEVELVLLFMGEENNNINAKFLGQYFQTNNAIEVKWIRNPPPLGPGPGEEEAMSEYYNEMANEIVEAVVLLKDRHNDRIERLSEMATIARENIWWPFTQHQAIVCDQDITVIDSARGDYFQTLRPKDDRHAGFLQSTFDGSASWWTQGFEHGNPRYALEAGYAYGRYGHVIFPKAIHEPALNVAETMLTRMRNPRLARVFFSDNGSTGVEVAIKMALRATRQRYGWRRDENLTVLGLKGGYHGDTLGAMNCAEPGMFNHEDNWYDSTKGAWLDCPSVVCTKGKWKICLPSAFDEIPVQGGEVYLEYLDIFDVFDVDQRKTSNLNNLYAAYITKKLNDYRWAGHRFGALMLEPVVLGAGCMTLVDPLFQAVLVQLVRRNWHHFPKEEAAHLKPNQYCPTSENVWSGLPIIFDEVFTGMFRLGRFSAGYFLGAHADISVHAKLLTGGLMPLCLTLASKEIFEAFNGPDMDSALLHGHSYTAHPAGCQVAHKSIQDMCMMDEGFWKWAKFQNGWRNPNAHGDPSLNDPSQPIFLGGTWSFWGAEFVDSLSHLTQSVKGLWALGSVLAIHFVGPEGIAQDILKRLGRGYPIDNPDNIKNGWNVHSRVLGETLYIISSLTTKKDTIKRIQRLLEKVIRDYGNEHGGNKHKGNEHEGNEHEGNEHGGNKHKGNEHEGNEHEGNEHEGNVHEGNKHEDSDEPMHD